MGDDISENLLKRLCSHLTGASGDVLFELNNFAIDTLNHFESAEALPDFSSCIDCIQRWLIHENKLEEYGKISPLLNNLLKSKVLQNKSAILNMLFCLRHNGISDSMHKEVPPSLPSEFCTTTLNGLHNISNFVHCNKMSKANFGCKTFGKTRPSSEVIIDKEENEKICGRVARLAALYKDHDFKESIDENISCFKQSKRGPNLKSSPSQNCLGKSEVIVENSSLYTDVSENDLIREILFSFQGIEGKVIKRDVINDCFKLDNKIRLSVGQRDLVNKLIEIGCLYNIINRFCEANCRTFGGRSIQKNLTNDAQLINSAGLVNQSLILAVKEELNEYCRLIAVLESQLQETSSKITKDASIEGLTLRRLLLWTLEPRCRLQTLALIIHSVRDFKGGASASALYQHLHHGDNSHIQVVHHALSQACRPLFVMLIDWLLDGNLQDPHHEFFIAADSSVPNIRMWHDKYTLRKCMLPSFISLKQAQKVLATGKSLNFLRHVCNFKSAIGDRDLIQTAVGKTSVESLFNQNESNQLDDLISLTFHSSSSHVLEEILNRHKLLEHLTALRKYILLGQGDFIHYLMEILAPELSKPASSLHSHNLSFILETAISASNVQYEEADILKRLDVRLLECSPGETGWDVFSLDYHVDGPIGTVLTEDCMRQYLMLFNSLWKAKHMECILSAAWKQQAATSKLCRDLPELGDALHCMQLLLTEMIHLVQQMAYYMTFEVLECSWHTLTSNLTTAQSLDDVIEAHAQFLKKIVAGALLDEDSREMRTHLRILYDLMVRLEYLQEKLYSAVVSELNARKEALKDLMGFKEQSEIGNATLVSELKEREEMRRTNFSSKFPSDFRSEVLILKQSYQDMVQSFLLMLAQNEDENLHLLSTRLDFNEHYHRKDDRLNFRLTYMHKRKSMGTSLCQ